MSDSTDPVEDHAKGAGEATHTPTTENRKRPKTSLLGLAAGSGMGSQAQRQWQAARDVSETIRRIRPKVGTPIGPRLKDVAAHTFQSRGPDGTSGAFGQLRGHLFEHLDIRDYNLRNVRRGYRLIQRRYPHNPGYDATRIVNGKFAGGIQHKSGPSGFAKAIEKIEAHRPGSAGRATFRVPKDKVEVCTKAAGGRARVEGSELTTKTIVRRAEKGLRELAAHGEAATSLAYQAARAAGKAAGMGAATSVAVGGAVDLRPLLRHELNARQFVARRGVDAAEGGITAGITAAATTTTVAGITGGATVLASTAAAGGVVATVAGAVALSTVVAPAAASIAVGLGVGYGVSRAAGPVRRYVTERLQSPVDDEREASTLQELPDPEAQAA